VVPWRREIKSWYHNKNTPITSDARLHCTVRYKGTPRRFLPDKRTCWRIPWSQFGTKWPKQVWGGILDCHIIIMKSPFGLAVGSTISSRIVTFGSSFFTESSWAFVLHAKWNGAYFPRETSTDQISSTNPYELHISPFLIFYSFCPYQT